MFENFSVVLIDLPIIIINIIITYLLTATELSLCGSSPCTSTDKINKNKYI
jgi:hypothetical protein